MFTFNALICFIFVISTAYGEKQSNLFMRVISFMTCPEMPNLPNSLQNVSFRKDPITEKMYISGVMQLTEPIEKGMVVQAIIKKCMNEDVSSCRKFLEVEESKFCDHLPERNKAWSSVVERAKDFVPDCPVAPGNYSVEDAYLDTSMVEDMQVLNGFWLVHLVYSYQGRPLMCLVSNGELRQKRKRKNKG